MEIRANLHLTNKVGQRESERRSVVLGAVAACFLAIPAAADDKKLDAGGLTFRDFANNDNGASFNRGDPMIAGGPNQTSSRIAAIEADKGLARIEFDSVRVQLAVPLGWQATEDWERGVAYSGDKRYRVIVWRVDFAFEGVRDAEHYAATKVGAILARHPGIQGQARKLGDGTFLVVYEGVPRGRGDSEPRTVFDLVIPRPGNPKQGILLTLGVPVSDAVRGLKLMALLKENLRINW